MASEFSVEHGGVTLRGEQAGAGTPVLLLHGLTATRRYVVMGSRLLERSGHRLIAYDARGHGRSSPAPAPEAYGYELLAQDALAVMDALGIDRAVLAGASMGAHTLLSVAFRHPERVAGIVVVTPAYSGDDAIERGRLERWDRLAEGLRHGGIDGFLEAFGRPPGSPEFARTVLTVTRQRLGQHEHLEAVADALASVPRSRPFATLQELEHLQLPAAVVVSSDAADPEHPEALGRAYAAAIPGARLISDSPGSSPVAWQGSQLSRVIAEVAAQTSFAQRR